MITLFQLYYDLSKKTRLFESGFVLTDKNSNNKKDMKGFINFSKILSSKNSSMNENILLFFYETFGLT